MLPPGSVCFDRLGGEDSLELVGWLHLTGAVTAGPLVPPHEPGDLPTGGLLGGQVGRNRNEMHRYGRLVMPRQVSFWRSVLGGLRAAATAFSLVSGLRPWCPPPSWACWRQQALGR